MCGELCIYKAIYTEMCNHGIDLEGHTKTGKRRELCLWDRKKRFHCMPYIMCNLLITCIYLGEL